MTATARSALATELLTRFNQRKLSCDITSALPGQFEIGFTFSEQIDQTHRDALAAITEDVIEELRKLGLPGKSRSRTYAATGPTKGARLVVSMPEGLRAKADELQRSFEKAT